MAYTIRLKTRAERGLDRLPLTLVRRIWRKLLALEKIHDLGGPANSKEATDTVFGLVTTGLSMLLMIENRQWISFALHTAGKFTAKNPDFTQKKGATR